MAWDIKTFLTGGAFMGLRQHRARKVTEDHLNGGDFWWSKMAC